MIPAHFAYYLLNKIRFAPIDQEMIEGVIELRIAVEEELAWETLEAQEALR